jgi:hypothetical protein
MFTLHLVPVKVEEVLYYNDSGWNIKRKKDSNPTAL